MLNSKSLTLDNLLQIGLPFGIGVDVGILVLDIGLYHR